VYRKLAGPATVTTLEGLRKSLLVDQLPLIKQLGENGGGFAINSIPFENPNGGTNLIEILAMLCIPAALIYTYGLFVNNSKRLATFWMVFVIFVVLVGVVPLVSIKAIRSSIRSWDQNSPI